MEGDRYWLLRRTVSESALEKLAAECRCGTGLGECYIHEVILIPRANHWNNHMIEIKQVFDDPEVMDSPSKIFPAVTVHAPGDRVLVQSQAFPMGVRTSTDSRIGEVVRCVEGTLYEVRFDGDGHVACYWHNEVKKL